MPKRASFEQLERRQLLPEFYSYPRSLSFLTDDDRAALMGDPLTPKPRANEPLYNAQRDLLRSFSEMSTDIDMRVYARSVYALSARAWDYVAACRTFNYLVVPDAIAAGTISRGDGGDIKTVFKNWHLLQLKLWPFIPSVS